MGIALKHAGEYVYLTGNDGGAILQEYIYSTLIEQDKMPKHPVMFNTVVTSDLGEKIAHFYNVDVEKTLTGFKYIGEKIEGHNQKQDKTFVFGYEESYGYLIQDFVRDKDALQACLMVSEAANFYLNRGMTLIDVLHGLFERHGAYYDHLESLALSGEAGLARIQRILNHFRDNALKSIDGVKVINKEDYLKQVDSKGNVLDFPKSNVLKYLLEDGSWIAIRPSGTEPKCKFYYNVKADSLDNAKKKYQAYSKELHNIIETI